MSIQKCNDGNLMKLVELHKLECRLNEIIIKRNNAYLEYRNATIVEEIKKDKIYDSTQEEYDDLHSQMYELRKELLKIEF